MVTRREVRSDIVENYELTVYEVLDDNLNRISYSYKISQYEDSEIRMVAGLALNNRTGKHTSRAYVTIERHSNMPTSELDELIASMMEVSIVADIFNTIMEKYDNSLVEPEKESIDYDDFIELVDKVVEVLQTGGFDVALIPYGEMRDDVVELMKVSKLNAESYVARYIIERNA